MLQKSVSLPEDFSLLFFLIVFFRLKKIVKIPSKLSGIPSVPSRLTVCSNSMLWPPVLSEHFSARLHFPRQANKYSVPFRTACLCLNRMSLLKLLLLLGSKAWAFGQWGPAHVQAGLLGAAPDPGW